MDNDFRLQLADVFTSPELAEYLDIDIELFIDAFEEEIENRIEDLRKYIGLGFNEEYYDEEEHDEYRTEDVQD